ncbi:MAG: ROK family transcriptional regulator [Solirubrobacterales bacterium]|nr:ROK family transcriptional regulator [Solirubrobacterales bacterium]
MSRAPERIPPPEARDRRPEAPHSTAHALLRSHLVAMIRDDGPVSRSELSRAIGLPRSTTTALVAELLREGVITESPAHGGGAGSGSGRPATLLSLRKPDGLVAGFDFGHRHLRVAVATGEGEILAEESLQLDVDRQAASALDHARELFDVVLDRAGVSARDLRAAAAGIPAPLNSRTGRVGSPTILASWVDLDPCEELRRRTGLTFTLGNDAAFGALGEMTYGAARDFTDFIYVKASNGIGAALVLNGRLYRGSHGMAGEIGHTQIDPGGAWCRCGNRGCLEATVSIDVVRRQLEPLGLDPLNPEDMEHPVATKVLAESGRTVGVVIANLCNTLNPEAVILGGDLSSTGVHFTAGVRDSVRHLAQPGPALDTAVLTTSLQGRAELLGAVACAAAATYAGLLA